MVSMTTMETWHEQLTGLASRQAHPTNWIMYLKGLIIPGT